MADERVYCADLCLKSGEPMLGTAPEVDLWLLLEYKPVWRAKATADNDLAAETRRWLDETVAYATAQGRKPRVQFVRRPELDTPETVLFVAEGGTLRRFRGQGYAGIQRLGLDSPAFEEVSEAQYFVCTNGQRDLCCARYGLPVYAELRGLVGSRAWQTTHLGGHRFAPNVLVLPQGVLYGRVLPHDVAAFSASVERGELSNRHVRGRSAYPPEAQVAETLVDGARALASLDGDEVTFETSNGCASARVERAKTPYEIIASCGRTATETVYPLQASGLPRRETA